MRAYLYTLEVLIALSAVFITIALAMKFAPTKPNVEASLLQLKLSEAVEYLESAGKLRELVYAGDEVGLEEELESLLENLYEVEVVICTTSCNLPELPSTNVAEVTRYFATNDSTYSFAKLIVYAWVRT